MSTRYAITGSYGNLFHIFDRHNGSDWLYDLDDSSNPYNTNSACNTESYLSPKRFMSPDDPIGSRLGLSSIFVAPLDAVEALFPETTSQTSSHSSYSDNNDWNKFDDSSNTSEVSPGRTKLSHCQLEDPNPTENTPSAPPTGSKRRKQILPSRADISTDSHCVVQSEHEKARSCHHKSKHRHRNKHFQCERIEKCGYDISIFYIFSKIREFYRRQDEHIRELEKIATIMDAETSDVLLLGKAVASALSGSLAIISSLLDSCVDLASGGIMWFAARQMRKRKPYKYPEEKCYSTTEVASEFNEYSTTGIGSIQ
ncbi:uncharacterized protein DC041_0001343 [Schistosoma bovis]|uniref:Cation efflux protein transmembrane domain-containing protein n=1 Tax=Schistosoma bovis TaxID=6184 RepID=A0A430QL32_SCHBO|nr:uncharacterized protein DC041_0001343 [Schistosoma bovis]